MNLQSALNTLLKPISKREAAALAVALAAVFLLPAGAGAAGEKSPGGCETCKTECCKKSCADCKKCSDSKCKTCCKKK